MEGAAVLRRLCDLEVGDVTSRLKENLHHKRKGGQERTGRCDLLRDEMGDERSVAYSNVSNFMLLCRQ